MSDTYDIREEDWKVIQARDKTCVYCRKSMKQYPHAMQASGATIEHFNNDGPFDKKWSAAICCRRCNSSRGTKELLAWFKTPYCTEKNINEKTVAKPVKQYIRSHGGRKRRRQAATASGDGKRLNLALTTFEFCLVDQTDQITCDIVREFPPADQNGHKLQRIFQCTRRDNQ
jgi:hypothetical protein